MSNNNEQYEDITGSGGKVVSSAKLAIGASIQGKLVALEDNTNYEGKKNLVLEDANGARTVVFTSGSLSYAVEDGKFEIGRTYRITRLENKITKRGQSRTQFQIQRLRADGAVAAPTENSAKPAGRASANR